MNKTVIVNKMIVTMIQDKVTKITQISIQKTVKDTVNTFQVEVILIIKDKILQKTMINVGKKKILSTKQEINYAVLFVNQFTTGIMIIQAK